MPHNNQTQRDEELKERLAAIEHERWASWQEWVHTVSDLQPDGTLVIPASLVQRWTRQIATPYDQLSEEEKISDRNQVDRYWHLIKAKQEEAVREALTTAKEIVMRKRDVYLTHRDVADESWLAIRDQLRREIVEDLDQQTPTQPNKKNG